MSTDALDPANIINPLAVIQQTSNQTFLFIPPILWEIVFGLLSS